MSHGALTQSLRLQLLEILENPMKILPARNIVICVTPPATPTKSGLLVPKDDKAKNEVGKVYVIGEGKPPIKIKVGDKVVYMKYTDNRVEIEGDEYNFINFKDICGKIKK